MVDEFRHADAVAGRITEDEYESISEHIFNSQATGDIMYASSPTQLSRLGITADRMLGVNGGIPAWRTPAQVMAFLSGHAGAAFDWGGQNLTNLGSLAAHSLAGTVTGGNQDISNLDQIALGNQAIRARTMIYGNNTYTNTGSPYGMYMLVYGADTVAPSADTVYGVYSVAAIAAANNQNWTDNPALWAVVGSTAIQAGATGTITGIAEFVAVSSIAATTVTNRYGLRIEDPTGAGTLTNNYGIYILNQTKGATLNYAIYAAGGDSYMNGDLDIAGNFLSLTEMAAPGAGAANTVRIYALEDGGGLTDLAAVFQDGSIDIFAQETTDPKSPIFIYPDKTRLDLLMRRPDKITTQFVAVFPSGEEFVMREIRHPGRRI